MLTTGTVTCLRAQEIRPPELVRTVRKSLEQGMILYPFIYFLPSDVVPHPLTIRLVPTGVLAVGSLAKTTFEFNVNGMLTSIMAMSKSWPLVPYAKFPPILKTDLTVRFC